MALVLALGVCGACSGTSGSSAGTGSGGTGSAGTGAGMAPMTVAVLDIAPNIPIWIAQQQGIFAKHGLNVKLVTVLQSTQAVPDLEHGTVQAVAGANFVSFFQAQERGAANIRVLTEAQACGPGQSEILVQPHSPIQHPQDLAGKTVAVNILNNIQTLTLNGVLSSFGVNTKTIHYVVVPFPDMASALAAGRVQAIYAIEPFVTAAEQQYGDPEVLDVCQGAMASIPLAGTISTAAWVDTHQKEAREFEAALNEAQGLADENQSLARRVSEKELKVSPKVGAVMNMGTWPTSINVTALQQSADLMYTAGLLKKPFSVKSVIFT